jgi:hypothetical protein
MPRTILNGNHRKQVAALRAKGHTIAAIAQRFDLSPQGIDYIPRPRSVDRVISCRKCDCELNPAGAMERDDRQVCCLACLAARPMRRSASICRRTASQRDCGLWRWPSAPACRKD